MRKDGHSEPEILTSVARDQLVEQLRTDYHAADLAPATRTILDFAAKLTATPGAMTRADLDPLRQQGFDDVAITDIVQAVAYFNYINRIADGLGVDLEPEMAPTPD